ncbi:MAG TPA: serine/threonine-protein kinase [Myxococcota bacterium]|nr:serine/threonine-protein kinase [Myxococcota bacterium]HOC98609.1 serine/threonine-protein kinase [Myxococcota bacterium]HOH77588.1 serine/threonine-protein kinase [Myxococcota bacterium]HPV03584.1 serine/threonine-protein kinase [Myxococcota bacterium]
MVTKMVGFGGYGRVYQAEQLSVGKRAVAIKVLHAMHRDRPATVAAFKREVSYLAMLRSPCFPRVIRTGLTPDGLPYFAMEFISGKGLDGILKSNGPLDINRAVYIMDRVCEGITEMHRKDIVHRDIKPGNVIVEEGAAKAWSIWMLDLGCAKPAYEPDVPQNKEDTFSFGSPPYMAPETVIKGVTNEQTDIYSLGCMAYEILTGIRAIHLKDTSADSYFAYLRNVEKPVPTYRVGTIVPELPEVVEQVIHRALVRDLTARYSSVMDFRNAFLSAAGPYLDRQASMSVDLTTSSNVSGFVRKDPDEIAKKSGLGGRLLLRFKKP